MDTKSASAITAIRRRRYFCARRSIRVPTCGRRHSQAFAMKAAVPLAPVVGFASLSVTLVIVTWLISHGTHFLRHETGTGRSSHSDERLLIYNPREESRRIC